MSRRVMRSFVSIITQLLRISLLRVRGYLCVLRVFYTSFSAISYCVEMHREYARLRLDRKRGNASWSLSLGMFLACLIMKVMLQFADALDRGFIRDMKSLE